MTLDGGWISSNRRSENSKPRQIGDETERIRALQFREKRMNLVRKGSGYLLILTGFLACPCHLPLLLALTAGTAFGVFLANNAWLTVAVSVAYFVGALALGWRQLTQNREICPTTQVKRESDPKWKINLI
jgi:mercuric ion transport protein